jgi:hypothetical protein
MGQFLIGTQGMGANLARFSYRYYSDSSYRSIGIFGNYRHFVDHPPYMYSYAPDTDFGTYCCAYNPTLGSLARFQPPAETTRHIQQPGMPDPARTTTPLGMAAIGLGDTTAHVATASITQNDVLRYANQFPMPLVGRGKAKVTSAELLTSQQISTVLDGETTGFPDDHALWFVQVSGTFVFPGGKGTSHHGYEVFDPSTGNLVMFGGMR